MEMKVVFYREGRVDPELFSSHAKEWAKMVCEAGAKQKPKKNKQSQIRKFYDEVLRFKSHLQKEPEKYRDLFPYIKMLNAKVAYAEGRGHITKEFARFIRESLDQLKPDKPEDFEVLVNFFEAFMGYYKYYAARMELKG